MITREDLKKIVMLGYLEDEMLDRVIPITQERRFDEKKYVFRQGDAAERLFMLVQGKVLLEHPISPNITVSVSAIKPGYIFGWSAMLDEGRYTTDALCAEPVHLFSIRSEKLKALFENNHTIGYIINQRLLRVIKKRYDIRTEQFLKAIRHHPDIGTLL